MRARFLVGVLLAAAALVKLVAVIPAVLLAAGDLLRPGARGHRRVWAWAVAAAGATLVVVPLVLLVDRPAFVDNAVLSQPDRPGFGWTCLLHGLLRSSSGWAGAGGRCWSPRPWAAASACRSSTRRCTTAPRAHVESPAEIIMRLRGGQSYLYAYNPTFALWSGRELYPWYYIVDNGLPRETGRIGEADFVRVLAESQDVILYSGEFDDFPVVRAYVEANFRLLYADEYFSLWTRPS
jgi:hypothetical protein